jgi:hypothetical protein
MLLPCLAPRTVLELLNPGGTFRVRDGVLLDPVPEPLVKVQNFDGLAAYQADASVLREFCRPGCRSVQLELAGVGGAVPCVLSVLAGDEEALVGVRMLELDGLRKDTWSDGSDGAGTGLDCGPEEAVGIEHLYDFQALEASLLGDMNNFHALEASLLGDTKRPFTAISESESEVSWLDVADAATQTIDNRPQTPSHSRECANGSPTRTLDPAGETAPLVIQLALQTPPKQSETVAAAAQTDDVPTSPGPEGVAGVKRGFEAGVLTAGFQARMAKNLPLVLPAPPPVEADALPFGTGIGKWLTKGGLAYHPKLGWHHAEASKRFKSKVAPAGDAELHAASGITRSAASTDDLTDPCTLEWAKSTRPRRKHYAKKVMLVCPDPPTCLP